MKKLIFVILGFFIISAFTFPINEEELNKLKAIVANNSIGAESIMNIVEKVTDGIEIKDIVKS